MIILQTELDSTQSYYHYSLYILDSMCAAIGQFSGLYSTVQATKFKTLFLRSLFQHKEI